MQVGFVTGGRGEGGRKQEGSRPRQDRNDRSQEGRRILVKHPHHSKSKIPGTAPNKV